MYKIIDIMISNYSYRLAQNTFRNIVKLIHDFLKWIKKLPRPIDNSFETFD